MVKIPTVDKKSNVSQEHHKPLKTQEMANRQFSKKNPLEKIKQYMKEETGLTTTRKLCKDESK